MRPFGQNRAVEAQALDGDRATPEQRAFIDRDDAQTVAPRLNGEQMRMIDGAQRIPERFQAAVAIDGSP
ncbi:hypothetical protein D3C73_1640810 [compost metagenome]